MMTSRLAQISVLGSLLLTFNIPSPHLEGTLLPRGFFLGVGLIYLAALAVDRLAASWRLPGAAGVLLLGLLIPTAWLNQSQLLDAVHVETLHRVSLALLMFYAGLRTDFRRIRGMAVAGLRLGCAGVVITVAITAFALFLLAPWLFNPLPPAAALLAVCCLGATDSGAIEDLLVAVDHPIRGRLTHLLQFEAAVSSLVTLLGFGMLAGVLQANHHGDHQALHGLLAMRLNDQLAAVGLHLLAGVMAGLVVGGVAPRLIDALVRSEPMLLLVTVALAFVAYGFGQILGGGGLLAVFVAGVLLSNGRYRIGRFEQQALCRVMHPLNIAVGTGDRSGAGGRGARGSPADGHCAVACKAVSLARSPGGCRIWIAGGSALGVGGVDDRRATASQWSCSTVGRTFGRATFGFAVYYYTR